ncbi:hypothetical protein G7K_0899-t1 [Saitoella complicata NRRL Y-17804]|uniref:Uncharacterized protein n=1 Tax=Saitoella complicata (strain BCRC 22490 / CBS 7301 / JCM 7358 / NBRC 10748 / NRRL Y-17804) TaxID=698492 RepID=A0A0E9NB94_SAICN|nr:hypothetical protein G7K_0899-t1 [Saitoella complicata NRRL Y-17804]
MKRRANVNGMQLQTTKEWKTYWTRHKEQNKTLIQNGKQPQVCSERTHSLQIKQKATKRHNFYRYDPPSIPLRNTPCIPSSSQTSTCKYRFVMLHP